MIGFRVFLVTILVSAISPANAQTGRASFYSGGHTASGEVTGPNGLSAAHRSLPFGTTVAVTNIKNGKTAIVRDLSRAAARELDMIEAGTAVVSVERQ
jgi:rare lipoprotein A